MSTLRPLHLAVQTTRPSSLVQLCLPPVTLAALPSGTLCMGHMSTVSIYTSQSELTLVLLYGPGKEPRATAGTRPKSLSQIANNSM